jgi:hypothetical protein
MRRYDSTDTEIAVLCGAIGILILAIVAIWPV